MAVFSADDSLGSFPPEKIVEILMDLDDPEAARSIMSGASGQSFAPWNSAAFKATDAVIGFVDHATDSILPAADISADHSLAGKKLKITLDRLNIYRYPGLGEHRILCEFAGKNYVDGSVEELRFATKVTARDGQGSSSQGSPIFVGLTAGPNGISFEGRLVSIGSSGDDTILEVLDSDAFKQGLSLINTVQPVIKPFAKLAEGIVRQAVARHRNFQVHHFDLGLDFDGSGSSTRLAAGSYVIVQAAGIKNWNWSDYAWNRQTRKIEVSSGEGDFPFNHLVIGVSEAAAERA